MEWNFLDSNYELANIWINQSTVIENLQKISFHFWRNEDVNLTKMTFVDIQTFQVISKHCDGKK